jgi:hypothetical protein
VRACVRGVWGWCWFPPLALTLTLKHVLLPLPQFVTELPAIARAKGKSRKERVSEASTPGGDDCIGATGVCSAGAAAAAGRSSLKRSTASTFTFNANDNSSNADTAVSREGERWKRVDTGLRHGRLAMHSPVTAPSAQSLRQHSSCFSDDALDFTDSWAEPQPITAPASASASATAATFTATVAPAQTSSRVIGTRPVASVTSQARPGAVLAPNPFKQGHRSRQAELCASADHLEDDSSDDQPVKPAGPMGASKWDSFL